MPKLCKLQKTEECPRSSHYIIVLARVSLELYGSWKVGGDEQVGVAVCSEVWKEGWMREQAGWNRGCTWGRGQMGSEWSGYREPSMLINKREGSLEPSWFTRVISSTESSQEVTIEEDWGSRGSHARVVTSGVFSRRCECALE